MSTDQRASIVIPCHDERRFDLLAEVVESAWAQSERPDQVVVAVDHNEGLRHRIARDLPHVTVVANRHAQGVSGNRNTGVEHTTTPLVAFLDDDVVAAPDWLGRLIDPLRDPQVVGTGGAIDPLWEVRPEWVPPEFLWAFGGSFVGLPTSTAPVRNVWSASMVVRRSAFNAVGGFRPEFGKIGDRSRPEDTELCIRMASHAGGHWVYVPSARIAHHVPAASSTFRYFVARCYNEGRGKVAMGLFVRASGLGGNTDGRPDGLAAEREYLRRSLPRAVVRGLADAVTGRDRMGAVRAAVVVVGVAAAGTGAVAELIYTARERRAVRRPGQVGGRRLPPNAVRPLQAALQRLAFRRIRPVTARFEGA